MARQTGGTGRVWVRRAGQASFVAFFLAVVALAGTPSPAAQVLAVGGVIIAFAHSVFLYGWSGALLFLSFCLVVTFATENLSIATGFPFGHYHFEVAAALPHVGAVPVIVGLLYFAMGYFSWLIASLLLDSADMHLHRPFNVVALPVIAAFVVVQWDVVMDPPDALRCVDMARRRRLFRRPAVQLRRLVPECLAVLPGFRTDPAFPPRSCPTADARFVACSHSCLPCRCAELRFLLSDRLRWRSSGRRRPRLESTRFA